MSAAVTTSTLNGRSATRSALGPILLFFLVGLAETLLAYFAFSRADDHGYFLELATKGLAVVPDFSQESMDLKAKSAGYVFYLMTAPGRWLGGHELAHLLWLRVLTLAGFVCAFDWVMDKVHAGLPRSKRNTLRNRFLILVLIYPGQLAWTASLLRDGVATALFFVGLVCLRWNWRLAFAPVLFLACFAMRPEYAIILLSLAAALLGYRLLRNIHRRVLFTVGLLLVSAMVLHPIQVESAAFGQYAFGEDGAAYPMVAHMFDIGGYLAVLAQGLLDPIPLAAPQAANVFYTADCVFFLWLVWRSRHLVRHPNMKVAALTMALLMSLWMYAYFEIYIGGFTRHRLCIEVALIAILTVVPIPRRNRPIRPSSASST